MELKTSSSKQNQTSSHFWFTVKGTIQNDIIVPVLDKTSTTAASSEAFKELEGNRRADYVHSLCDKRLIVYFSCTVSSWSPVSMQESYYHRRVMQAIHCNMRVYKSKSEALWDGLKIGDVRTFDEIAVLGINYAYRPKTCFGVRKKWEELYAFADCFCNALKRRHNAKEHHASLHVGLRLDIGVS
ncbi:Uncharacterized protein HZ326_22166 [Fusarium oxysporum f. sp. albedinis]|nr:Uncharacterized protein HZ326_22166 [Fusarium oxysporum f. sp. albedinis]